MSFFLDKKYVCKKILEMQKSTILGQFLRIEIIKRPTEGFLNTPDTPKRYQLGHNIGKVIIWGLWGIKNAVSRPFDRVNLLK